MSRVLSLSVGHDSSVSIFIDGKLEYYRMAERLSRIKHDWDPTICLEQLVNNKNVYFDTVIISYFLEKGAYYLKEKFVPYINKNFNYRSLKVYHNNHHLFHAYGAVHNCSVDNATVVVLDGAGEVNYDVVKNSHSREVESIYYIDFKNNIKELLYKRYWNKHNIVNDNKICVSNKLSVGWQFEEISNMLGFGIFGAGKVMGLAQYHDHSEMLSSEWQHMVDVSYECQRSTEESASKLIQSAIDFKRSDNIIVTGGYGLNCVANLKFLKTFKNKNILIDPICFDAGISIGAALFEIYSLENIKSSLSLPSVYLGSKDEYKNFKEIKNIRNTSFSEVASLLQDNNIVAIHQGASEAGQRALGNRSLLYNPTDISGKDYINKLKGRENFRPFGCSILEEFAKDWFDVENLKYSPYMQFAFNCKQISKIPSVVHVDGTSRIQTVNEIQNKNLYFLLLEFYRITNIPLLLNTSLNYAGEPLAETLEDSINSSKKIGANFLYLPELQKIIEL